MAQQNDPTNPFDPFGTMKGMRDTMMENWSKMMIQIVNSDEYSKANGAMMDSWLSSSGPFRKAIENTMTQVLTQLNMPTRTDVTTIAERLTNIELRLDDMEAQIRDQHSTSKKGQ